MSHDDRIRSFAIHLSSPPFTMLLDYLLRTTISRLPWICSLLILYISTKMLSFFTRKSLVEEDASFEMTNDERERMKTLEIERGLAFDRFYRLARQGEPSLVLDDFLFLGNMQHATNRELLERFQIKHILNVCDLRLGQTILDNYNVIHIPMPDEPRTNIKQHFDRTNELLHGIYEKKERCLVHCAAGVSRSATIVLAYLMKYHHHTLKEAFEYLIEKRPQIWPNEGFLLQLIRYETELLRAREISQSNDKEDNPLATLNEFEYKHPKK